MSAKRGGLQALANYTNLISSDFISSMSTWAAGDSGESRRRTMSRRRCHTSSGTFTNAKSLS